MVGAVRISSGQDRLDLSDVIDGNGTVMSFAGQTFVHADLLGSYKV